MLNLKRITFSCLAVFLICFSLAGYAEDLQKFQVQNNDTVVATISERELSRFVFAGDKIKQIFTLNGEFYYEIVDENLYLKPNAHKLLNFFVNTESGNTYKIIATPKDIPATQIHIKTKYLQKLDAVATYHSRGKLTGEYIFRKKISKLIKAIKSDDRTLFYKVKDIGSSYKDKNGFRSYLISRWHGEGIAAEKHLIANNSKETITLNRHLYLDAETDAVYITKDILRPGERALLIKLKNASR